MADTAGSATRSPRTGTVGALVAAMAEVIAARRDGDDALHDARELLAALHDMPRHWPTVERATAVSTEEWQRGLRAAEREADQDPQPLIESLVVQAASINR